MPSLDVQQLEKWRNEGISNTTIAGYMSGSSEDFKKKYDTVKSNYGETEDAARSMLNYRFYGDVNYQPPVPMSKGILSYPARVLDNVYEGWKQTLSDVSAIDKKAQEGEIDPLSYMAEAGGRFLSGGARPFLAPWEEIFRTKAFNKLPSAEELITPAVQGVIEPLMQTKLAQDVVIPAAQRYAQESEQNPALRGINSLVRGGAEAGLAVLGTPPLMKLGNVGYQTLRHPIVTATETLPGAIGSAGRAVKSAFGGSFPDSAEFTGIAKEMVKKGIDENLVRFMVDKSPEEKSLMRAMTSDASAGEKVLGGTLKPKQTAGAVALRPAESLVQMRKITGKAKGALVEAMADESVDLTIVRDATVKMMEESGVVFNNKSRIISIAGASDDEIPLLQKVLDSLPTPDEEGRSITTFRGADQYRQKIFSELNMAQAKMQPTKAGQTVFGVSDRIGGKARSMVLQQMATLNPNYGILSEAYSEMMTKPSAFFRKIGFTGNLEDLSTADLKTGEVALRMFGGASADIRSAYKDMLNTARKYGYKSPTEEFEMNILRYADALEDVFPIAPTRSLRGEVKRAGEDVTKNVIKRGFFRSGLIVADEKIMRAYQIFRGMTPENRLKLMHDLLDSNPQSSFLAVAKESLPSPQFEKLNQAINQSMTVESAIPGLRASISGLTPEGSLVPPSPAILETPRTGLPQQNQPLQSILPPESPKATPNTFNFSEQKLHNVDAYNVVVISPSGETIAMPKITIQNGDVGMVGGARMFLKHRGRGLESQVLSQVEEWARGKGLKELHFRPNKAAIRFFKEHGYRDDSGLLTKNLFIEESVPTSNWDAMSRESLPKPPSSQ